MIQIGAVYTIFCQEEGILLQNYRDRNGRCIAILFKSIGVRRRFDSPESGAALQVLRSFAKWDRNYWRRTNVQQLTCNIDLSCSFY